MKARRYETLVLLHPELTTEELDQTKQKFVDIATRMGGRLVRLDDWGRRKLAYPVKKHLRGTYFLMDYMGQPDLMSELERNMRIDERVFKFLTLVIDKDFTEEKYQDEMDRLKKEKLEVEAEEARKAEAAGEVLLESGEEAPSAEAEPEAAAEEEPPDQEEPRIEATPELAVEAPSEEAEPEVAGEEQPPEQEETRVEATVEPAAEASSEEAEPEVAAEEQAPDVDESRIEAAAELAVEPEDSEETPSA